jgi:hypothetical protein
MVFKRLENKYKYKYKHFVQQNIKYVYKRNHRGGKSAAESIERNVREKWG